MRIEITYDNHVYHWSLYDGPDGIDSYFGTELNLGQCFESIVEKRIINGLTYSDTDDMLKKTIANLLDDNTCVEDSHEMF